MSVDEAGEKLKYTVVASVDYSAKVNYALQQNDVPTVREIRLENAGTESLADLDVLLTTASGASKPWGQKLLRLNSGESRTLTRIDLQFDSAHLANLLERERTELILTVRRGDETLWSSSHPLEVLAFNEWPGLSVLPEIIAAFVGPNHPALSPVISASRSRLQQWTGDGALNGYQSGSPDRCFKMLAAAYQAMREQAIGYINPPASFEQDGQKVRTADQVIGGDRSGTCLDLTVVAAALLEQMGLYPLIILTKGHAFVGAWLNDTQFSEPAVDDASRISNRVALKEIGVFETTVLCDGKNVPFDDAARLAARHLDKSDEFLACIDVRAARRARILPLPPRVRSGNGFLVVEQAQPLSTAAGVEQIPSIDAGGSSSAKAKASRYRDLGLPEESLRRLDLWKRKLLDLSLRNPMLNFRVKTRSLELLIPDIAMLEDRLAGGKVFSLLSKSDLLREDAPRDLGLETQRSGRDIPTEMLREEFSRGVLRADASTDTLINKLVELFRTTRTNIEESGSNTLFLALGSLTWFETEKSEDPKCAPLLLVPVKIERPHPQQFRLQAIDEEARVNVTLIEKLRQDYRLDASHLVDLEEDDSGVDVGAMLRGFRQVVKDMRRWEVRETAFLGTFSFAKFVLWADLDLRLEQIAANPTVKFILSRAAEGSQFADFPSEQTIDQVDPLQAALCPLDADSSQQAAIEAAIAGKTFVLQGPPGTGKSQTITNLIARAAAGGKRVLFVAEKLAALSVVRSRLQKVGLGPFTLELHSNKGGKKEVVEQLRTALEALPAASDGSWTNEVEQLAALRKQLNDYVVAIHTVRPSGETVYDVMSRMAALGNAPAVNIKFESILTLSARRLNALRMTVSDAVGAAKAVGNIADHPLKGIRSTVWRLDIADKAREALESALTVVRVTQTAVADWLASLGVMPEVVRELRVGEIVTLFNLTKLMLQRERARGSMFAARQWQAICKSVPGVVKAGQERDALREQLSRTYAPSFFTIDHGRWIDRTLTITASNVLIRWFKARSILRELQPHFAAGKRPALQQIAADLGCAARVAELSAEIERSDLSTADSSFAGGVATADWAGLESEAKWANEIHAHLDKLTTPGLAHDSMSICIGQLMCGDSAFDAASAARRAAEAFLDSTKAFQKSLDTLEKLLQASVSEMTGQKISPALPAFEQTVGRWLTGLPDLREWTAWQEILRREDVAELKPLFAAVGDGTIRAEHAKGAFEAAYAKAWLNSYLAAEPSVNRFTYEGRTRLVEDFRAADRRVMRMSSGVLNKAIASSLPSTNLASANATSELGILKRQLQLQRNHKPVRRLVKELPTVLPRLKPIWLMSPLSVAQFLDPATPPFDLVVFDEASQIPVWDAIGALARGAKAVIVGDSKQLPPTDFFQRQEEEQADPDENNIEELESILDECIAADFPELRLRWHYRSRHESLIAFSNHQYYDNHLHTFPSADASVNDRLGVRLEHVKDGRYDRGGSRTNEIEAKAVVAELFDRLREDGQASIGIVTFSSAQQKQVEDLIDSELKSNPAFRSRFDPKESEYVFVKNLENVQGDERDTVFFSICYGTTPAGKTVQSFGPINRDGGERRLNVAVTRARQQLVVFSSIKAEQISLSTSRSRGLADLKLFLDYAERGPQALLEMQTAAGFDQFDSPFEQEVCRAIRDRGWTVDTQVGCSGYRIDMAVQDPAKPGRYLLGIECDGASYHSAASARDRDRLREDVLRGLGWQLHRVWSTDWLQNREKALRRVLLAIEQALAEAKDNKANETKPVTETVSLAAEVIVEPPDAVQAGGSREADAAPKALDASRLPGAVDYVRHHFSPAVRSAAAFYLADSDRRLSDDLNAVIETEAPIHVDELNTRVAQAWGLSKVTKRVEARLQDVRLRLRLITSDDFYRRSVLGGDVSQGFRVPLNGDQRPIEYVAEEELKAAVVAILTAQYGLPAAELEREVARQFGYQRAREVVRQRIRLVIEALLVGGEVTAADGMIRLK